MGILLGGLFIVQKGVPILLPHELREQIISSATFERQMAERGWTVTHVRKAYTDPAVFRQQWLICPNGAGYPERTFYRAFGSTLFRKLFRYMLSHVPCPRETLEQICPQQDLLTSYLTFMQDQEWFSSHGHSLHRGPYQAYISNIGRTLEWYVAEWLRLTYSLTRLAPVYHGVQIAEMPLPGDLDVVAILGDQLLAVVECKSASDVDEAHFSLFLQRVQALRPDIAILLIDTPAPFPPERITAFNAALRHLELPSLTGNRGFYRGVYRIHIVNVEHSIATSLNDVLRSYFDHS
ncbi:MAG TPA: hypothetical protein VEL31_01075 [Ktedonobacteraceae bacterium]|nr:hypothetical protein [Ktedonobacteraceae bacterium]